MDLVCDKVTSTFFSLINLFSSLVYTYRYLKSLPKGMQQVREVVYFIEREPSLNYYFAEVCLFCLFVCLFIFFCSALLLNSIITEFKPEYIAERLV